MYISKEELNKRLKKTELSVIERERKTRSDIGSDRLNHEDRVVIGILSTIDSQQNIADLVGVSSQTVSNVSRSITTPTVGVDKDLKEDIQSRIQERGKEKIESSRKIEDQLLTNLAAALGQVANNLDGTDAVEASKVAVDMSKILERVNGNREERGSKTAIIINVPVMKEEKNYQTIVV